MNKAAQEALDKLMQGNRNFVEGISMAQNRTVDALKNSQTTQTPIACILCCSDSRMIPEIFFDQGIGNLFVVRGAGAVIGPNILESIEFAVESFNIPLVLVLSHDDCGVMKAAIKSYPVEPTKFLHLLRSVYEIIGREDKCYNDLARDYTLIKKRKLLKRSRFLRKMHSDGNLEILRGYLHFDTGELVLLD